MDTETEVVPPPDEAEGVFAVRRTEWRRIQKRIEQLKPRVSWLMDLALALAGVAIAALVGAIAWSPVRDQLPSKARTHYAYVLPLLWAVFAAAALCTVVFLVLALQRRGDLKDEANDIVDEMDTIERAGDIGRLLSPPSSTPTS